jgi:drug/metabolite transporter (DMT)-like permease
MSCYDRADPAWPRILPTTRTRALVALHTAVLLFGLAGLFGKWLELPPVLIVLGRTTIAAVALAVLRTFQRTPRLPFEPRLIGNGVLLALHWFAFFEAIRIADVATGLLGYASFPLFVLVLERVLLGRRWAGREAATAVLVTGGLGLLVPELSWANRIVQGLAWGLVCGFTFALLAVVNRSWAAGRPATDVAFWQNFWAALALLPLAIAAGPTPPIGLSGLALLLVLGLVCTAFAHTLFIAALRTVTAHTASVIAALEPVYGIALALLLLDEVPGWRTVTGAVLIVGAAILASQRGARGA